MRLINTLHTRKLLKSMAAFAAFGLLASTAQAQLLIPETTNGDFESDVPPAAPADWDASGVGGGTLETSALYANTGTNSLLIDSTPVAGTWSSPNVKQVFPACAGNEYYMEGYMYIDAAPSPNTWGVYKIEFYDENGNNIEPESISIGALDGAGQPYVGATSDVLVGDVFGSGEQTPGVWHLSRVQTVAPFGTVEVGYIILNVNGGGMPIWYDSIQGSQVVTPLAANGDFDSDVAGTLGAGTAVQPAGWTPLSITDSLGTVSNDYAQSGTNSLLIDTTSIAGSWVSPGYKQTAPAIPGDDFYMSGYIYNPGPVVANVWGTYKLEFYDANGNNLEPASISLGTLDGAGQPYVGAVSAPLVGDVFGGGDQTVGAWVFSQVQAVAPVGTVEVGFIILNVNGGGAPLYYDSVTSYLACPGIAAKIPLAGLDVVGADITATVVSEVTTDYEAYTSPDLVTWTPSGVTGVGTGSPVSLTVPGSAPGYVRVVSADAPVTTPAVLDCIIVDALLASDDGSGCLGSGEWSAFAAFDQGGTLLNTAWGLCDAPFISDGFGTATFGMNDNLAIADPFWAGASQTMSVFQEYYAPENTYGARPLTDLGGKSVVFTGTATVSEAYAVGNTGEVFVLALTNDGSWGVAAQASVTVGTVDSDPTDGGTIDAGGNFSVAMNVPDDGINVVQVGFRNTGIEGTAGEMTVTNLNICVDELIDTGPFEGELLTNGDFSGVDATEGLTGWEVFGTYTQDSGPSPFTDGSVVTPITDTVNWTAGTPNTAELFLMDAVANKADENWNGVFANPAALQQVFWSPDGPAFGTVRNLYGQTITYTGNYTVTEAPATNLIRKVSGSGAGMGIVAGQESASYTVTGLNGSLAGTGLGAYVLRDGTGAVIRLGITDQGNAGFAVGETITIPSASVGGGGDIVLTVDVVADNKLVLAVQSLDGAYANAAQDDLDVSAATVGVSTPFSITHVVPASGLNLVQVQVRVLGVENTAGKVKVDTLSAVAAP